MFEPSQIPIKPGVYFFKDAKKKVLYVGKAINLRVRLRQYFRDEQTEKIKIMLSRAKSVDFCQTDSEIQAVVLEAKLIKTYRPKYNSLLKDDKRYLYLGITKEDYPRVKLVRRPELENLLFWTGPFPSSLMLKQILRWVRKIFPYCSCKSNRKKPCLYFQIGLCPGPKVISKVIYRKNINNLILFFSGQSDRLLKKLGQEMDKAAKRLAFEEAGKIKNQIQFLERMIFSSAGLTGENLASAKGLVQLRKIMAEHQGIELYFIHRIECFDIANFGKKIIVGAMSVLENGEAELSAYRRFKIYGLNQDDPACLAQIIDRRLSHQEWFYPQLILVDGGKPQLQAVLPILRQRKVLGEIGIVGLAKENEVLIIPKFSGEKVNYQKLVLKRNSPALKLLQYARDESHRFGNKFLKSLSLTTEGQSGRLLRIK